MNKFSNCLFRFTASTLAIFLIGVFQTSAIPKNLAHDSFQSIQPEAFFNASYTYVPGVTYCVRLIFTQPGYGVFQNSCAFDVYVEFFDEGRFARTPGGVILYANGSSEIMYTGPVRFGACRIADGIVNVGDGFKCRSYGPAPSDGTKWPNSNEPLSFRQPVKCNCPGPNGYYLAKSGIVTITARDYQSAIVEGQAAAKAFCAGACPAIAPGPKPAFAPPLRRQS